MLNLPDPRGYKSFKPKANPAVLVKDEVYNLEDEIKRYNLFKNNLVNYFELVEMFGYEFIGKLDYQHNETLHNLESEMVRLTTFIKHYKDKYGGVHTHSSLAILLYDENNQLKTASIRRVKTKSGEVIKWLKVKGSSATFIPYRLRDEFSHCFVAFGMSEALIFNALGVDYFTLQSDSIALYLDKNPYFTAIKERLQGRDIVILPDYDESGLKAAKAVYSYLKGFCYPRIIEFYKLVDNPPKGYDFRDYIKEIQDKDLILENLLNLV
ncbi:hypothetical protein [Caminibacter sp.]